MSESLREMVARLKDLVGDDDARKQMRAADLSRMLAVCEAVSEWWEAGIGAHGPAEVLDALHKAEDRLRALSGEGETA